MTNEIILIKVYILESRVIKFSINKYFYASIPSMRQ